MHGRYLIYKKKVQYVLCMLIRRRVEIFIKKNKIVESRLKHICSLILFISENNLIKINLFNLYFE